MRNRMTLAAACIVVLIIAASSFAVQPTRAQNTAQAKADECLGRPGAATPKGSHWYYRLQGGRRCWYLGPANQRVVRPAAATERTAPAARSVVPTPAPAPSELQPDEQTGAETPAAVTTDASTTAATAASSVAATNFSAAWPRIPNGVSSSDRDAPVAAANTANTSADPAEDVATAQAQPADMPLVRPVVEPADRTAAAAAPPAASTPGLGHLLLFLTATVAFVAIAFRAILKLSSGWFARREPIVRRESPVIRRRVPEPRAPEPSIEAMSEPAIARLREVAKRWEQPARVPRQPHIPAPAYEVESDDEVNAPPPWRRRVA